MSLPPKLYASNDFEVLEDWKAAGDLQDSFPPPLVPVGLHGAGLSPQETRCATKFQKLIGPIVSSWSRGLQENRRKLH